MLVCWYYRYHMYMKKIFDGGAELGTKNEESENLKLTKSRHIRQHVPEGLLRKRNTYLYKALKKQVEEIRSNDPAGTMFQCKRMRFQKFGTEF